MAKMHSRSRGKSGSKKPPSKKSPEWTEYSSKEIEELIVKMAREGMGSASIGQVLRDQHGIPSVQNLTGKPITQIMKEGKISMEYPEDLMNLIKRAVRMRKHLERNNPDVHNKVKLIHVESKIRRLVKYYRVEGVLPRNWSYDPNKAALLVK